MGVKVEITLLLGQSARSAALSGHRPYVPSSSISGVRSRLTTRQASLPVMR